MFVSLQVQHSNKLCFSHETQPLEQYQRFPVEMFALLLLESSEQQSVARLMNEAQPELPRKYFKLLKKNYIIRTENIINILMESIYALFFSINFVDSFLLFANNQLR